MIWSTEIVPMLRLQYDTQCQDDLNRAITFIKWKYKNGQEKKLKLLLEELRSQHQQKVKKSTNIRDLINKKNGNNLAF
jgi:hemolysin-activating ACP:hemolysin acyltransferase